MSEKQDSREFIVRGPGLFGAAIKEFRHQRGLTQHELAEHADMHRSYLANLETGASTEAITKLMRAFAALDVEVIIRERSRH